MSLSTSLTKTVLLNVKYFGINRVLLQVAAQQLVSATSIKASSGDCRCCASDVFLSTLVLIPSEIVKAKTQVIVGNVEASSTEVYKKMIRQHGLRVSKFDLCE